MIDELAILKDIVIELTNAGGYALFSYIAFQLVKLIVLYWPIYWIINKLVSCGFEFLKSPISKEEANNAIQDRNNTLAKMQDLKTEHSNEYHRMKREIEDVKHMYKVLKEAKDDNSSK